MSDPRQIFDFSGLLVGRADNRTNADLIRHALSLTGMDGGQRVCFVPTAVGDSPVAVESERSAFAESFPDRWPDRLLR